MSGPTVRSDTSTLNLLLPTGRPPFTGRCRGRRRVRVRSDGPPAAAGPGTYLFTPEQWEPRRAEFCRLIRKPADAIEQVKEEFHQAMEDLEELLAKRCRRGPA
ncbi:hypothetical protein GCM10009560_47540 [Nonomuraea longicatena]|uniref:Uncharacterized protein n=1 Tax=Nonomuraea longicatena TaxID=83682 RepID=A0ABN1Q5G9_9ACTN